MKLNEQNNEMKKIKTSIATIHFNKSNCRKTLIEL